MTKKNYSKELHPGQSDEEFIESAYKANPESKCEHCQKEIIKLGDMTDHEFASFRLLKICVRCFTIHEGYNPDTGEKIR